MYSTSPTPITASSTASLKPSPGLEAATFLNVLAGGGTGYIAVSHTPHQDFKALSTEFIPASNTAHEALRLHSWFHGEQVIVGVGRFASKPTSGRGKSNEVAFLSAIGIDIDVASPSKQQPLPETVDEALALAQGFALPPTMLVNSGRGVHAYWAFEQDLSISTQAERKHAQELVKGFHKAFAAHAQPYKLDATHDLARMLRLPGTMNLKDPSKPVPVQLLNCDADNRYSIEQIEHVSAPWMKKAAPAPKTSAISTSPSTETTTNSYDTIDIDKVANGCEQFAYLLDNGHQAGYNQWFTTASLLWFAPDGRERFHAYSQPHPEYDPDDCNRKFDQVNPEKAARTCASMPDVTGQPHLCMQCPFNGGIHTPIELGHTRRLSVCVEGRQLRDKTAHFMAGIYVANEPPRLFTMGTSIVRVNPTNSSAEPLDTAGLRHEATRLVDFHKMRSNRAVAVDPPDGILNDLKAQIRPPLPALKMVSPIPVIDNNGNIASTYGYHPDAQVFITNRSQIALPESATAAQASESAQWLLKEVFGDFPFADASSKANTLALMLQPILRALIDGPTPLYLIDKPVAGTGATLLATVATYPYLGRDIPIKTWPNSQDERRKLITAHLLSGVGVSVLDNLSGNIECDVLASVLTSKVYSDRVLGSSTQVSLENNGTWIATGNNPVFSAQLSRRIVRVRLIPDTDTPALRNGFAKADLRSWVATERDTIMMHMFTMVLAWLNAGRPLYEGNALGSYEAWSSVIGGVLEVAGVPGFLSDTSMQQEVDAETLVLREFAQVVWDRFGENRWSTADMRAVCDWLEISARWDAPGDQGRSTKAGLFLRSMLDRWFSIELNGKTMQVQLIKPSGREYRLKRR